MAEQYDSSDEARYRLVDVDELDALLAVGARPVLRDQARLTHLLARVRGTLEANRATISGLHRHIGQVGEHLGRVGQATTLNPLDALRYLDDDQRELLFDRIARERLAMLRHMVEQAEGTRAQLLTELEQVRGAAQAMAQRPDLPPDVRAEYTRLLAFLPTQVAPVERPALLDYPDPEPMPVPVPAALPAGPVAAPAPVPSPFPLAAPAPRTALAPVDPEPPRPKPRTGRPPGSAPLPARPSLPAAPAPTPAPAAPAPVYRDPYAPARPPAAPDLSDLFD